MLGVQYQGYIISHRLLLTPVMAFHFVFPRLPISKHVQIIVNWSEQIFWTVLISIMNEKLTQGFAVQKLSAVIFEAQRTSPLTQTLHWNFW